MPENSIAVLALPEDPRHKIGDTILRLVLSVPGSTEMKAAQPKVRARAIGRTAARQASLMQIAFASQELRLKRPWPEGAEVIDSANVPCLRLPPLFGKTPSPRCVTHPSALGSGSGGLRRPDTNPAGRSGWWGAQRSGIKEEAAGRGTAAELSAPPA